jgi:predicted nucleotidyltransferase
LSGAVHNAVAKLDGLPAPVVAVLSDFLAAARVALADDLVSAVLFGSAADATLGPTSDINLLLVLRGFAPDRVGRLREALLTAEAAIKLRVMFLREAEIASAVEFFAQKFADILRRHRVVFGKDVFATLTVPRNAEVFRLKQILLNLVLRLREAYASRGHRPEQATRILAEALGPLRAGCATLLELEGAPSSDATAAFTTVAQSFGPEDAAAAAGILAAHAGKSPMPDAGAMLLKVLAFATHVSERAARLG